MTRAEKPSLFARVKAFAKEYGPLVALIVAFISGTLYLRKLTDFEPTPNANLQLDGFVTYWMNPNFNMSDDLEMMGLEGNTEIRGVTSYEMLMGSLKNRGLRDAEEVEIKVPIEGTVAFGRSVGGKQRLKRLSRDSHNVVPGEYVLLGDLRADDPPYALGIWCSNATPLTEITFRYREGDATKTVQYLAKAQPGGGRKLSRVIMGGKDQADWTTIIVRWMLVILGVAILAVVCYRLRYKIRTVVLSILPKPKLPISPQQQEPATASNTSKSKRKKKKVRPK